MRLNRERKIKVLVPANDNTGGRRIVVLQSDHCVVFPAKLGEEFCEAPQFSLIPEGS
jgi:hypothetical protein